MKRNTLYFFFLIIILFSINPGLNAEVAEVIEDDSDFAAKSVVSPFLVFHDIGWNALDSLTYNYGMNFIGAGLGTWAFIETGLDWNLRNAAYNNNHLANMGLPLLFAGYFVPVITPVSMYLAGRYHSDTKLQITAVAVAQSLILSQITQVSLKMLTGRSVPGIISGVFFEPNHVRDTRENDFSGEFNWFTFNFYDGWPSGHVVSAFSAAAVISEIYDDKPLLKMGVYTYAVLMGVSVAVNAHWVSESVAGALMGYAIGKAVGKNFNRYLGRETKKDAISLLVTHNSVGVNIRI